MNNNTNYEVIAQRAFSHLRDINEEPLSRLLKNYGPLVIPNLYGEDPLFGLVKIIIGQQLSNQSANTIWSRLNQTYPKRDQLIANLSLGNARLLGISKAKARTIANIVNDTALILDDLIHQNHKLRMKILCNYWGIGPWTVEMWSMFICHDPDIWSPGDLILKRVIENLVENISISSEELINLARPYRSYLALYCWKTWD